MTNAPPAGLDLYTWRARVTPALLVCAPMIALGVIALAQLAGIQKIWAVVAPGLTTFAALAARRAGNAVQPRLWAEWGGPPAASRLRFRSASSSSEIRQRHREVERALGLSIPLPDEDAERSDADAADAAYEAAMRRLINLLRGDPRFPLVQIENRNYGFARNLFGMRKHGIAIAVVVLALALGLAVHSSGSSWWHTAGPALLPGLVSVLALAMWTQVDEDFVRPSADAYADRLLEAAQALSRSGAE